MPLRMRVYDREPIGTALRRFKKLLERSGLKKELRKRKYYEKPCELRRRAKRATRPADDDALPLSGADVDRRVVHPGRNEQLELRQSGEEVRVKCCPLAHGDDDVEI